MSTQIATAHDAPTHRLTVKLEDGSFRQFYLTVREAEWLASVINSVDPFICLPKSIDSRAPSFYPKRGATMSRLTREEIAARGNKYAQGTAAVLSEEQEAAKAARSRALNDWIAQNPTRFEILLREAHDKLHSSKGIFHSAGKETQRGLVKWEARRMASELVAASQNPAPANKNS